MCVGYMQILCHFYIKELVYSQSLVSRGSWNQSPEDTKG